MKAHYLALSVLTSAADNEEYDANACDHQEKKVVYLRHLIITRVVFQYLVRYSATLTKLGI